MKVLDDVAHETETNRVNMKLMRVERRVSEEDINGV